MRSGTTWLLAETPRRSRRHLTESPVRVLGRLVETPSSRSTPHSPSTAELQRVVYVPCPDTVRQFTFSSTCGRALGHALVYGFMSVPPHIHGRIRLGP